VQSYDETEDIPAQDMLLELIVAIVDDASEDLSVSITLTVGGTLISGRLCSLKRYINEGMSTIGPALLTQVKKVYAELGIEDNGEPPIRHYVHLRDARMIRADGSSMPTEGMWWRGRLAAIDAFTIGEFLRT
jgi:hypothetical protein